MALQERPSSLPFSTQSLTPEGFRLQSDNEGAVDDTRHKFRAPILGPTRQQTELYMFRMAKQKLDKLERLR